MGLPQETPVKDLINEYRRRIDKPIDPVLVNCGPCKENIVRGEDLDLLKFPVPYWHPRDGGRYIGTWYALISKDLETGTRNAGLYRMMVVDKDTIAIGFLPFSHLGLHYSKAEDAGKPLPVAAVIGCDELLVMAAAAPYPYGVDEIAMAGALKQMPIELVKCETSNIEVPANAEIILEGEILPYERVEEGPFGEHTGYHGGPVRMRPIFKVKCITYRNNPILRGTVLTKPINESSVIQSKLSSRCT
jgi:UbiD family decarboxylase